MNQHDSRACPFCHETIYANALVCRFCRRDLPPPGYRPRRHPSWLPIAFASAIFIGAAALLSHGLQQEKRCWQSPDPFGDDDF